MEAPAHGLLEITRKQCCMPRNVPKNKLLGLKTLQYVLKGVFVASNVTSYADAVWDRHKIFFVRKEDCVTSPESVCAGGCI